MLVALPHTAGCLACGRDNPHGIRLDLAIDRESGIVETHYIPTEFQIGFTGIAHGGVLATVFDEAMVWAATWAARRFCYCAEMTVRFREPARVGDRLAVEARVLVARRKLVTTLSVMRNAQNVVLAESTGKYVPMSDNLHRTIYSTLIPEPANAEAIAHLAPLEL